MSTDTSPTPSKPRSIWQKIHRAGAVLFYAVLAGWIAWLAVTRWNGEPADREAILKIWSDELVPIDPALDRTDELMAALGVIPSTPILSLPPAPSGMKWDVSDIPTVTTQGAMPIIDIRDALAGEWTPRTRPNLVRVIDHITSPGMQQAMHELTAIPAGLAGCKNFSAFRNAVSLLVARMRYDCAVQTDIDGAIDDYESALRVSALLYHPSGISILVGRACEGLAHEEIIRLSIEFHLSREQAIRVRNIVEQKSPNRMELWNTACSLWSTETALMLDSYYTNDGHGNGWFVLSNWHGFSVNLSEEERSSGAWNALSALFASRRRVQEKIAGLEDAYRTAQNMPYSKANMLLEAAATRLAFNHLDGPFRNWRMTVYADNLRFHAHGAVWRRGAIVAAALSAHHSDHRAYPQSLTELMPEYLQGMPLDPFADEPFRYAREEGGGFRLYSVGENCVDDGGVGHFPLETTGGEWKRADILLTVPRPEPQFEPGLIEVEPDDSRRATDSESDADRF